MLAGERSWLAVFGPGAELPPRRGSRSFSYRSSNSDFVLHLELGEDEHPPAVAERDETAVLLDGVLLDRRLVLSALGSRPPGRAEGDAALVLTAYVALGERVFPLLRGSFALIIWDGRRSTLVCARDPTDSHPLFFSRWGGRVLVSASHGPLLDAGRVSPVLDRVAIARWVVQGSMRPRRTFYERVERLPPGHLLTASRDNARVARYWHPGEKAPPEQVSPDGALRRLEELLDQAVGRCASLGRLGVFLSGGVDSAAVGASAAIVSRERSLPEPLALSYVYPDPEASEEAAQRAVAGRLGIPQRVVSLLATVGDEGLLAAALRLSRRSWMPCVNPWEPAFVHLAEEGAARGCAAILSGEGGNDWFEAEWYEAADLLRRLELVTLWRLWSQERVGRTGAETARVLLWTYGARPLLRDAILAGLRRVAAGGVRAVRRRLRLASLRSSWALPDRELEKTLADEFLDERPPGAQRGYRELATGRKLDGVHLVVPMENRFLYSRSLRVRFFNPAVDPDLVEFLYGLPSALLNFGGRGKGLAWESVRRRVGDQPAALLGLADLEGFVASVIRDEGPRALEELGGLPRLSELGIVNERAFARALSGPALGGELGYYQAWQALASEAWLAARLSRGGCGERS